MSDEARALLVSGDIPELLRHLRFHAEGMEVTGLAALMERAAAMSGFDDLRDAAAAAATGPAAPEPLYGGRPGGLRTAASGGGSSGSFVFGADHLLQVGEDL